MNFYEATGTLDSLVIYSMFVLKCKEYFAPVIFSQHFVNKLSTVREAYHYKVMKKIDSLPIMKEIRTGFPFRSSWLSLTSIWKIENQFGSCLRSDDVNLKFILSCELFWKKDGL